MAMRAPSACLKVQGSDIVDADGTRVILKGAATGGHTNMENFITGYPGHESEMRAAMLEALGEKKYNYFFDKFLNYFFQNEDAQFLASLGLNCLRIPINYHHFMDDLNPSVIKSEGFKLLDRVIEACSSHGIYTIIDMHTFPGGHNVGWHSDSAINRSLFWKFKDLQDRMVNLWIEIARYYRGNTWIAGYNPMNEPADPEQVHLQAFYARIEEAIHGVDPEHMLFLDGNTFSMDFTAFKKVLPNCVYSMHDYATMGFPAGQPYVGSDEQNALLVKQYERKAEFMKTHNVPIWNGEFGPVYANASVEEHQEINQKRYNLLGQQLSIYKRDQISWSIWLYKDIGFQGMVFAKPDSAYMTLLKPWLEKKKRLGLDRWGRDDSSIGHIYAPVVEHFMAEIPEQLRENLYPPHWGVAGHVHTQLRDNLLSNILTHEYASYFKGKSYEELDELAASFKLENCVKRDGLNELLRTDAGLS